jgi:hypothetical protein
LFPKGQARIRRPLPMTGYVGFEVEVLDPQAGQLGEAHAGVDEQPDDGQIPPFGERPPGDRAK